MLLNQALVRTPLQIKKRRYVAHHNSGYFGLRLLSLGVLVAKGPVIVPRWGVVARAPRLFLKNPTELSKSRLLAVLSCRIVLLTLEQPKTLFADSL